MVASIITHRKKGCTTPTINKTTNRKMKEFIQVMRRFVPPYKKYLVASIVFNILSAVLNIFSFMTLIPILNILFKTEETKLLNTTPCLIN